MIEKRCKDCISGATGRCSLRMDEHLQIGEKCGSFAKLYIENKEISDYNYEYGYIEIDKLTDEWLDGKDVDEFGLYGEF